MYNIANKGVILDGYIAFDLEDADHIISDLADHIKAIPVEVISHNGTDYVESSYGDTGLYIILGIRPEDATALMLCGATLYYVENITKNACCEYIDSPHTLFPNISKNIIDKLPIASYYTRTTAIEISMWYSAFNTDSHLTQAGIRE